MTTDNPYRDLPSVDELASRFDGELPRPLLVDTIRAVLGRARTAIAAGREVDAAEEVRLALIALRRSAGTVVINATGVLLHTNLGRARWSESAIARASETARQYTNLELDLETGDRGQRGSYVTDLLRTLTGAEDALVVNNNASALLLALAATSGDKSVPVSRGELIEIGGSYRLPEVIKSSGVRLVEVGTTNRTRVGDYETAIQVNRCGSILKVHPSNYVVSGFTTEATVADLADLAHSHGLPLIHDIGSGLLDAGTPWLAATPDWLRTEPGARQSLEQGADLVTFSGDKLLGGPQAGIIVGNEDSIASLRRHPLARALRVDGPTYAALAITLEAFAGGDVSNLPFWRQALLTDELLRGRATVLAKQIGGSVRDGISTIGGGSAPGARIETPVVALSGEDHLFELLLGFDQPILALREDGDLILNLRTVDPEQDSVVVEEVNRCR